MVDEQIERRLRHFGFTFGTGGAHTARTIMLDDLQRLLETATDELPSRESFARAIVEDNCLSKRSGKTRELTLRHLTALYALDGSVPIFRVLHYFWRREKDALPMLALLCSFTRDALLRKSWEWVAKTPQGEELSRDKVATELAKAFPERFSTASLKSIAQNLNGSWTRSGHLRGKVRKFRSRVKATPAAVAYALYLGYLRGLRGEALFQSEYAQVLDVPMGEIVELSDAAARRGWIVIKRLGNVVEVLFPNLITLDERKLLDEQG